MSFSVDVVSLVLFCIQQLGVMLAVGAETVILIAYLVSMRDGVVEAKEEQFGRAVSRALNLGLFLIILSGVAITLMHLSQGATEVVFSPAYLFKWLLIGGLFVLDMLRRKKVFMHFLWEGVVGANWYALFIVHILAPVATWTDLLVLCAIWNIGFILCFVSIAYSMRARTTSVVPKPAPKQVPIVVQEKKIEKKVEVPKQVITPVPPPKPIPPPIPKPTPPPPKPVVPPMPQKPAILPALAQPEPFPMVIQKPLIPPVPQKPPMSVPQKPQEEKIKDPDQYPGLPAIRVMPRTQADVDNQNRATTVQFE